MKIISIFVVIQLILIAADDANEISNSMLGKPCNNSQGECVFYYLCEDERFNTDGFGIIDFRMEEEDNGCDDAFLTCCSTNETLPLTKSPPGSNVVVNPTCGYRNVNGVGLSLKSKNNESEFGEFPWTLALLQEELIGDQLLNVDLCGASLISPSVALTAAHCLNDKIIETLKVRAGEWDSSSTNEIYPNVEYKIQEIIIHEHFNKVNVHNDIALLILKEPVKLAEHINTICLPPQDYNFDGNKKCFVTGWGKDQFGRGGKFENILKKIKVSIVPFDKCQNKLRETRLGKRFILDKSFMCAGDEQNDSCQGDGGSALFCPIEGKTEYFYQAGIVSWGIACKSSTPGVYVNIAKFRTWIDEKIQSRNLSTSRYSV